MSIGQGALPGPYYMSFPVIGHLAATATELVGLFSAPKACQVYEVVIHPTTNVTGADTHTTHINLLLNATEKANKDLTNGVNLTAHTEATLYSNATGFAMAAGEHLNLQIEKVGNGLLVPAWTCRVQIGWK